MILARAYCAIHEAKNSTKWKNNVLQFSHVSVSPGCNASKQGTIWSLYCFISKWCRTFATESTRPGVFQCDPRSFFLVCEFDVVLVPSVPVKDSPPTWWENRNAPSWNKMFLALYNAHPIFSWCTIQIQVRPGSQSFAPLENFFLDVGCVYECSSP